jgi:hypothetical protein
VLVIGPGISGSEIAREIGPYTSKLYVSSKDYDWNKLHPFRRRAFRRLPSQAEVIPEIRTFGPLEKGEAIREGRIELVNGTTITGVDEVSL